MPATIVNSPTLSKSFITQVASEIKSETKALSCDTRDSILRDSVEAVKHFSWEIVWFELSRNIPTLISFLSQIIPSASQKKSLIGVSLSKPHTCRRTSVVMVYIYIYIVHTFCIIYACSNLTLAVQYSPMCSAYACYAVQCFILNSDTLSMTKIHLPL